MSIKAVFSRQPVSCMCELKIIKENFKTIRLGYAKRIGYRQREAVQWECAYTLYGEISRYKKTAIVNNRF